MLLLLFPCFGVGTVLGGFCSCSAAVAVVVHLLLYQDCVEKAGEDASFLYVELEPVLGGFVNVLLLWLLLFICSFIRTV